MTFQKNLLGLVVPEPCISRTSVAAETPAAAVRMHAATSAIAEDRRGMTIGWRELCAKGGGS